MRPISSVNSIKKATMSEPSLSSPPAVAQPRSPWHSPVPYLFGGLAAMLGLIAFALLLLACSYWRLSGRLDNNRDGGAAEGDVESGDQKESDSNKVVKGYEEKILVIMAGDEKPTFLATPVSTKSSSFDDKNGNFEEKAGSEKAQNGEKVKEEMGDHDHGRLSTITENSEDHESQQTQ